jgi:hypothetical protein
VFPSLLPFTYYFPVTGTVHLPFTFDRKALYYGKDGFPENSMAGFTGVARVQSASIGFNRENKEFLSRHRDFFLPQTLSVQVSSNLLILPSNSLS